MACWLEPSTNAVAAYVHGLVCLSLDRYEDAGEHFSTAESLGYDAVLPPPIYPMVARLRFSRNDGFVAARTGHSAVITTFLSPL